MSDIINITVETTEEIENINVDVQDTVLNIDVTVDEAGAKGDSGNNGQGVPMGGTYKQRLVKIDSTDYNTTWETETAHGLNKEIQFNDNGIFGSDANLLYDKDLKVLSVGRPDILPNNPLAIGGNSDSYIQANIQNKNNGISASSDFVATADDGDDSSHYIDMGINNSTYDSPDFSGVHAHEGYVLVQDGNLALGSTTAIKLLTGGFSEENTRGTINDTGIDLVAGNHFSENGFNIVGLIKECASEAEQNIAFALGTKLVIRTDLL